MKNYDAIVETILSAYPDALAIYRFGSWVRGQSCFNNEFAIQRRIVDIGDACPWSASVPTRPIVRKRA